MSQLEERHTALEQSVRQGGTGMSDLDTKRRYTLVFGGWGRDTKRDKVLQELQEAG